MQNFLCASVSLGPNSHRSKMKHRTRHHGRRPDRPQTPILAGIANAPPPSFQPVHLARGHGLGDKALQGKLLLLQVVRSAVVELQGAHGVADGALDLLLLAALELQGQSRVGDNLLDTADVGLELLLSLELLAEGFVVALESLGVWIKLVIHHICRGFWTYR